jgi:anhydro-N-acetylmuramic acid kinase
MRTIVGTMTGTSMDGVDAVAVTINGEGLAMTASFVGMASCNLGDLSPMLRALALGGGSKQDMHAASEQLGKITARAIKQLQLASIDMIALHGQTTCHQPVPMHRAHRSAPSRFTTRRTRRTDYATC